MGETIVPDINVVPIPGGVLLKSSDGKVIGGGSHDRAWERGLDILRAVIYSSRRNGGEPIEVRRESLREFIKEIEAVESYDLALSRPPHRTLPIEPTAD